MAFFKFVRKLETEEVLTDEKGDSRATYGYTAYGKNDEKDFTGVDKPDPQTPDQEPYNVYRFNSKRWDASTGEYDMGFRNYSPGLNRFTTRDMYSGAMADMNLATDPWNNNRYAFAGGNPVSGVELDGHAYAVPGETGSVLIPSSYEPGKSKLTKNQKEAMKGSSSIQKETSSKETSAPSGNFDLVLLI